MHDYLCTLSLLHIFNNVLFYRQALAFFITATHALPLRLLYFMLFSIELLQLLICGIITSLITNLLVIRFTVSIFVL